MVSKWLFEESFMYNCTLARCYSLVIIAIGAIFQLSPSGGYFVSSSHTQIKTDKLTLLKLLWVV